MMGQESRKNEENDDFLAFFLWKRATKPTLGLSLEAKKILVVNLSGQTCRLYGQKLKLS